MLQRLFTTLTLFTAISTFAIDELRLPMKMYSSQRAYKTGDLVTVLVAEETSSSKSESMETEKSASATVGEGSIGGATNSNVLLGSLLGDPKSLAIPITISGNNSTYNGKGAAASTESLKASYTARVVDVLPNDVLVIRGERSVEKNGEKIQMVLTGSIRRQDISATNTIDSTKMADARIFYKTTGDVSRGTRPGFLWRLFQFINPF